MSMEKEIKKYTSFKIPERARKDATGTVPACLKAETATASLSDGTFYEIEYDSCPIPGVGRFVRKPVKIEEPEKDEVRELFRQMRDIARSYPPVYPANRFFDRQVHQYNAAVFYRQAVFMKDFTDDYTENTPFTQYFPFYQLMGYEQLRTYFTWRTEVRKGNVTDTSLSYVFLYMYELLGNIGVSNPQEGLEKLLFIWNAFRVYNPIIDKYVLRWLKDYHIYYELPQSFRTFITTNHLTEQYPGLADPEDSFALFCAVSKYDIRKSAFFTDDRAELIRNCFLFTTDRLRQLFLQHGMHFDETVFQPAPKMPVWTPFKDALFFPWLQQPDRRVVLSEKEVYICRNNVWTFSTVLTNESGKTLIGYILKQMEAALRRVTKYKYKLSANSSTVTHEVVGKLKKSGVSLEDVINGAVSDFYKEATKIVVKVDAGALSRIRQEALATQEKLIVPEQEAPPVPVPAAVAPAVPTVAVLPVIAVRQEAPVSPRTVWEELKSSLTATEMQALAAVVQEGTPLWQFAGGCGILPEVLADGINEKAMDCIGDNVLDEELVLYEEYRKEIKKLVGCI